MIQLSENSENIQGKRYWKSLDDLADTPGFRSWLENEFPECSPFITTLRGYVSDFQLTRFMAALENTHE